METEFFATDAERQFIFDSKSKLDRDYWIDKLSRPLGESNIRLDFERPEIEQASKETTEFWLPPEIAERLFRIAAGSDHEVYVFCLAGLNVCLQQYAGSDSVVVGAPARLTESRDDQAGNALPILSELDGSESFRTFASRIGESLANSYLHQDYPVNRVIKDLGMNRSANRCPLFDFVLAMSNTHAVLPDLNNDITIILTRSACGLHVAICYKSGLFLRATIERFAMHYASIIERATQNIDRAIRDLDMLSEAERHQALVEWNDTARDYQSDRCIHHLFQRMAGTVHDGVALHCEEKHVSYDHLNERANQLAHYLRALGIGPEVIVGLRIRRSIEMVLGVLGILKAGGAFLTLDPAYPDERTTQILQETRTSVVLTERSLLGSLSLPVDKEICLDSDWEAIAKHDASNPISNAGGECLAYIIYTSGSTGRPKGVLLEHRGVCDLVHAQIAAFNIGRGGRVFQFASLSFDASVSEMFTSVVAGASLILRPEDALYAGAPLAQMLCREAITEVTLPPSILADTPSDDIASLKTIISAGEACSAAIAARWSLGRRFINAYGPTEVTVCATMFMKEDSDASAPPVGRPIVNKQTYVLDGWLRPASIGVKAQLYVGGEGLARGYFSRPDLTADRFIPDPFSGIVGARIYNTGDLALYAPGGDIVLLGRSDRQVKIRGNRIELAEVEVALSRHPAVAEAVVVVSDDSENRLVVYLVPHLDSSLPTSELRAYLAQTLPEYMIPSAFVTLRSLPLTPNGKVDLTMLPAVERDRSTLEIAFASPRTDLEAELTNIFGEVLGVDGVGINDNFFELGGHSLLAIQVISRLRDRFEIELPVQAVFEAPTVAELVIVMVQNLAEQSEGGDVPQLLAEVERLSDDKPVAADQ
jgi:amino acid adenylation domain-containing protein